MSIEDEIQSSEPQGRREGKANRSGLMLAVGMMLLLTLLVYLNMG